MTRREHGFVRTMIAVLCAAVLSTALPALVDSTRTNLGRIADIEDTLARVAESRSVEPRAAEPRSAPAAGAGTEAAAGTAGGGPNGASFGQTADLEELSARVGYLRELFHDAEIDPDDLMRRIQDLGARSGVEFGSLRTYAASGEVGVSMTAHLPRAFAFLAALQEHRPLLEIASLSMQPRQEEYAYIEMRVTYASY